MSSPTLEERVVALERQMAALQSNRSSGAAANDWRSSVGMFTGDNIMKEIDESARKLREANRRQARRTNSTKLRAKKCTNASDSRRLT